MDLKQLNAVVTVAEVGSITGAARLLHLVQPSVTRQVRMLEDELGVALFDRTATGMSPTPAGRRLVERARRVLQEVERARAELRPSTDGLTGIVTVGLLESVVEIVAEPLVRAVAERHPGIELRLLTAYSGHLQQWLDTGEVGLSLLYDLDASTSLSVTPLLEEELWAVAPAGSGLSPGTPVTCREVFAHPLVLPVAGHGLRSLVDRARAAVDAVPRVAVEVNSMQLQKTLVRAGHGWTLLPAAGVSRDADAGLLDAAPVTDPDLRRHVVLGRQRGVRDPAREAVAVELRRVVRRLVEEQTWTGAREPRASGHG